MMNDDSQAPDESEQVDSFDDLTGDTAEPADPLQLDAFDDLDGDSSAQNEPGEVDSFDDLGDDLVIQGNAGAEPIAEQPTPSEDDSGLDDLPAGTFFDDSSGEAELEEIMGGLDDQAPESESAEASEEIGIAGESESAAVSQEIDEVAACASIVITPQPETIVAGEQVTFSVEAFDKDNNPVDAPTVKWTAKGGEITKDGIYTVSAPTGLFSVKASTKGLSDRVEGVIEALPVQNEWLLASFFSACGIYLALALIYFLDPAVLGPSKNFIGYINFDWAISTILVAPCLICFISSSLGMLSKPKGKEWLWLLPSLGPLIPVLLGAISIIALLNM